MDVWIDYRRILAGQDWNLEIQRALDRADIVLAIISHNSVDRRGYLQREIKFALEKRIERLSDDIYIIPVLLDGGVALPVELRSIQAVKADDPDYLAVIMDSIAFQLERLGQTIHKKQEQSGISWHLKEYREEWDGLPGYEAAFQIPRLTSQRYPLVSQISAIIEGEAYAGVASAREVKLQPQGGAYNFGQERYQRTDTWDAVYGSPVIRGRMLSISGTQSWYSAGAAHPNHGAVCYNFILDPIVWLKNLRDIFAEPDDVFSQVQQLIRETLLRETN